MARDFSWNAIAARDPSCVPKSETWNRAWNIKNSSLVCYSRVDIMRRTGKVLCQEAKDLMLERQGKSIIYQAAAPQDHPADPPSPSTPGRHLVSLILQNQQKICLQTKD